MPSVIKRLETDWNIVYKSEQLVLDQEPEQWLEAAVIWCLQCLMDLRAHDLKWKVENMVPVLCSLYLSINFPV